MASHLERQPGAALRGSLQAILGARRSLQQAAVSADAAEVATRWHTRAGAVLALAVLAAAVAFPPGAGAKRRAPAALARAHAAVVGGAAAEPGTFPWMADVLDVRGEEVGQCSGTVLAPELILTAGHCAENPQSGAVNEASGYRVVTGNLNWAAPEGEKQVSGVSRVIVCSCFDRQTTVGDVALLELSTPTTAPAVTLASPQHVGAGAQALFAGWGDMYSNDPVPVQRLRWAPTVIQAPQRCEREASPFSPSGELCVLDPPALRTGACNGDSGGPLLVRDSSAVGGMAQIGVASHVYSECATTSPSVFTRVAAVSAWIRGWLGALAPGQASAASAPDDAVPAPELAGIARAESLSVRNGTASLTITCDAEGGVCAGTAEATMTVRETLIARRGGGQARPTRARRVRLISSSFSIAPGAGIVVRSRLSRQVIALLSHLGGAPIDVELTGQGVAAGVLTVSSR